MVKLYSRDKGVYVLDVTGYICPYPVVYTRKVLAKLQPGERLEVIIDNPPSRETVPNAAKSDGHEVLGVETVGRGVWKITIIKKR